MRYTPHFILHNLEKGKLHGAFPGYVLYFDLVDFTHTCDVLQKEGKRGAEEISHLLQTVFNEPLSLVEKHGGYVIRFVGDAFLAVFKERDGQNALAAALAIRGHFVQTKEFPTHFGPFPLRIRQMVSYGKITWRIFTNELQNEYIFRGKVLQDLHKLARQRRGLVFTEEAVWKIGRMHFAKKGKGFEPLLAEIEAQPYKQEYNHNPKTAGSFLHLRYHKVRPDNDIRRVVCCFANLEDISYELRNDAVAVLQTLSEKYSAYLNKLTYGEKGLKAMILFGMPRDEGESHIKACRFTLEAVQAIPLLSFGISSGELYAGFIGMVNTREYTALGHPVNLAARLVETAKPAEIITSGDIMRVAGNNFDFEYHATSRLKGIGSTVKSYKLKKVLAGYVQPNPNKFIGRESEKALLRGIIKDTFSRGENNAVYLRGKPGVGKTRLVIEALRSFYNNKYYIISMQCELLIPKPLFADKRFIRSFYGLDEGDMNASGLPILHKNWIAWADGKQEILDLEPMLAAYLGLLSMDLLKKEHPEWMQQEKQAAGWMTFLSELAARRNLLLIIDDLQRIDYLSREYLLQMAKAGIKPVCFLLIYTEPENSGKIDLHLEGYTTHELELKPLSVDDSLKLYQSLLGVPKFAPDTEAEIRASTQGNPSQIMKVCSGMLKAGLVSPDGDFLLNRDTGDAAGVTDILSQILDHLDDKTRDCISTASVLGMRFNLRVLTAMLDYDPQEGLLFGVQHRIWREEKDGQYAFVHVLNHEVAYRRLMSDKLAALHLRAAQALETVFAEDLDERAEEIADHYDQAGLPEKAKYFRDLAPIPAP